MMLLLHLNRPFVWKVKMNNPYRQFNSNTNNEGWWFKKVTQRMYLKDMFEMVSSYELFFEKIAGLPIEASFI